MMLLLLVALDTLTVAVADFENLGGIEESYANAFSSMLITSLSKYENIKVLERESLRKALEEFRIQTLSGIDPDAFKKLGDWLGADGIITGSFTVIDGAIRVDARVIDTKTGIVLTGVSYTSRNKEEIPDSIASLITSSLHMDESKGEGTVEIYFRLTYSPLATGKIFHQIVRLYIDGVYMGTSPPVRDVNKWEKIFALKLKPNRMYKIKLEHGYVEKGKWLGPYDMQPETFNISLKHGEIHIIKYEFVKGSIKNFFKFINR